MIIAKIKKLYLINVSNATGRDCFATDSDNVQLINDFGRLRLMVKSENYVSKSYVDLGRYFKSKIIRRANEDFINKYLSFNKWTDFFRETDLGILLNNINWCGINPVFQLLTNIKQYEPEIQLVI